jgi:RimJ/RimL family protein N-acetyltransferase
VPAITNPRRVSSGGASKTSLEDLVSGPPGSVLDTPRLWLREFTLDDLDDLHQVLGDPETMRFYPQPKTREGTLAWIEWCRLSYEQQGFGLWALILKETEALIGDCGLTVQDVDGEELVEVGYHVKRSHWRWGLATEAALASRDHAFDVVGVDRLIALVRVENEPSAGVARKIGMSVWKETDRAGLPHVVYSLTRKEWLDRVDKGGSAV